MFGLQATEDGIVIESEQERPVCYKCKKSVQAKGGNTTNLFDYKCDNRDYILYDSILIIAQHYFGLMN